MHDNTNSHNSHNYQDISNPYKNHLITSHIDMRHKHYMNMDSNKQKSQYIKIKNFKLKIKSPLRQTLKEMINKQKIKKNKKYGYSTLNTKKSNSKYKKSKDPKNIEGDKEKNTLMYSLELPEELIFHNIFVCPISKETATKENPPIRLNCGHCICKNSFEKIEKTGTRHNQIKCPICTQVGKIDEITNLIIK